MRERERERENARPWNLHSSTAHDQSDPLRHPSEPASIIDWWTITPSNDLEMPSRILKDILFKVFKGLVSVRLLKVLKVLKGLKVLKLLKVLKGTEHSGMSKVGKGRTFFLVFVSCLGAKLFKYLQVS